MTARQAAAKLEEVLGNVSDASLNLDDLIAPRGDLRNLSGAAKAAYEKFRPQLSELVRGLEAAFCDVTREADAEEEPEPREPHDAPEADLLPGGL